MNGAGTAFGENGWCVIPLRDSSRVQIAAQQMTQHLQKLLKTSDVTLTNYHQFVENDGRHTEIQAEMTAWYRAQKFGQSIIQANLEIFKELVGNDLNVQSQPYLRITRPAKPQDNIGYHRDTFYGGSPYEVSVLIPFVQIPAESSVRVISGSHRQPESKYPTDQTFSEDVAKGSTKHQLGFLYAPKVIRASALLDSDLVAVPLNPGQALMFSLSTVHGSTENRGATTRWSSDIRVMNALAPVDLSLRPTYYEPLCRCAVTREAGKYFESNPTESHATR
jgi:sporadic carbohydrate cluster 2OG-Fe(II) oxygenase